MQSGVPTRRAEARFMLPRRMEGGWDYTRYSQKRRPEGALSSYALFPNPRERAETMSPTGEVTALNSAQFLLFLIRRNGYL